jgi:hypothetical protein
MLILAERHFTNHPGRRAFRKNDWKNDSRSSI